MNLLKLLFVASAALLAVGCATVGDVPSVPRLPASSGSYPIVVESSYTTSADGLSVKDSVTGLTWQKTYELGERGAVSWVEIQAKVDEMNAQKVGGFSDWRVPTIKELYSLWNGQTGWPYLDTKAFPLTFQDEQGLSHAIFLSSTKYTGLLGNITDGMPGTIAGSELAFGVNFGTGHFKAYATKDGPRHFFRAVRGNLAYGVNLFQDNKDGTVTDAATSLMWQQKDGAVGMDFPTAKAYAEAQNKANFLGHNDWRLPTSKELQTLVDYTRSPGATSPAHVGPAIDPLFTCTPITNEAGRADYPYYWTSVPAKGSSDGSYSAAWYVAFGRAVNENGEDLHGAGAIRFDSTLAATEPRAKDAERVLNFVRLVRTSPERT
jgi:hypothetical protein